MYVCIARTKGKRSPTVDTKYYMLQLGSLGRKTGKLHATVRWPGEQDWQATCYS